MLKNKQFSRNYYSPFSVVLSVWRERPSQHSFTEVRDIYWQNESYVKWKYSCDFLKFTDKDKTVKNKLCA